MSTLESPTREKRRLMSTLESPTREKRRLMSTLESPAKEHRKMIFSIDEILKPSFGSKKPQDTVSSHSKPLDMTVRPTTDTQPWEANPVLSSAEESSNHSTAIIHSPLQYDSCSDKTTADSPVHYHIASDTTTTLSSAHGISDSDSSDSMEHDTSSPSPDDNYHTLFHGQQAFTFTPDIPHSAHYHIPHNSLQTFRLLSQYLFHHLQTNKQLFGSQSGSFNKNNPRRSSDSTENLLGSQEPFKTLSNFFHLRPAITGKGSDVTNLEKGIGSDAIVVNKPRNRSDTDSSQMSERSTLKKVSTQREEDDDDVATGCGVEAAKVVTPRDWPAWVYCTRYSDRPSSGPRYRKPRRKTSKDKRPRTAFSTHQLQQLRHEFQACPYLSEPRRQTLAFELGLNESQVKIWFQNKRAKLKKSSGSNNILAQRLMEEGLYNHSTIVVDDDSDDDNCQNDDNDDNKKNEVVR